MEGKAFRRFRQAAQVGNHPAVLRQHRLSGKVMKSQITRIGWEVAIEEPQSSVGRQIKRSSVVAIDLLSRCVLRTPAIRPNLNK